MQFKNVSKKVINMNIDGIWHSIDPEDIIELPVYVGVRQKGLIQVKEQNNYIVEPPKEEIKPLEEELESGLYDNMYVKMLSDKELKKMTKDQLNDYAAKIGLEKINSSMLKDKMISEIKKHQKKLIEDVQ